MGLLSLQDEKENKRLKRIAMRQNSRIHKDDVTSFLDKTHYIIPEEKFYRSGCSGAFTGLFLPHRIRYQPLPIRNNREGDFQEV